MEKIKILKISKGDLEKSISNLSQLKPVLQKQCIATNLDNLGKNDARELGKDFDTAINAMITILGLMEDISVDAIKPTTNN